VRVSLWRGDSSLVRVVTSAAQRHHVRTHLYCEIDHDGVVGYGEVSPQPSAVNGDPSVADVIDELVGVLVPRLVGIVAREGDLPEWSRAATLVAGRDSALFGASLLEMALLDREQRRRGERLAALWPARVDTPLQATVSLLDDEEWVVGDVARVRVKSAPGALSERGLARLGDLARPIVLDFNCSATASEVIKQVARLRGVVEIDAIEQPFAPGNLADAALLARELAVDLSVDEGLRSYQDLVQIARYHAATMICVKPARLGGFAPARSVIARARELGMRVYLGGFFESDFARRVNRAFANAFVDEASDVGPVALEEESAVASDGLGWRPAPAVLARAQLIGRFE
jgi:o-succinylbenzoate synthase